LEERLKQLAKALMESSQAATAIESELELRQRTVQQMARTEEHYEEFMKLNRQQREAVDSLVGGAVGRNERRAFMLNTGVSFVLGVVSTIVTEIVLRWTGFLTR
jgi:hypothetical protein